MTKLSLNLDHLAVVSFATAATEEPAAADFRPCTYYGSGCAYTN